MPGKKKPYSEFQAWEEWSVAKEKYVEKERQIDREHNHYFERVTDKETGKINQDCSELLDLHFGHGSDKKI